MSKVKEKPIDAEFTPAENNEEKKMSLFEKGKVIGKDLAVKGKNSLGKGVHYVAENAPWLVPVAITFGSFLFGSAELFGGKQPSTVDPWTRERLNLDHNMTNAEIVKANELMREQDITKAEALDQMGLLKEEKKRK